MSDEEWRQLYERLSDHLGTSVEYWMVFDPIDQAEHESILQTLADDLSDIYRDVLVATVENGQPITDDLLWSLRFSFETHWGHHAVNAIAAIHSLLHGPNRLAE